MAVRANFTVEEVIDELDGESEDDFDGCLDTEINDTIEKRAEFDDTIEERAEFNDTIEERGEDVEDIEEGDDHNVDIGANVEIDSSDTGVPEYSLNPGCSATVEGNNPLSFFSLLINNSILQTIVDQTNLYAQQFISSHDLGPHSHARSWVKRTSDIAELLQVLAIIIVMGIVPYPQIESHWSTLW